MVLKTNGQARFSESKDIDYLYLYRWGILNFDKEMKIQRGLFFFIFFLALFVRVYASGSGKASSHSSFGHSYSLGTHATSTSSHHNTNSNVHSTAHVNHTNTSAHSYSYSNPKSSYHSSIIGNSTYFRANKNPPKHSAEDDRYNDSKKAKVDKEAKAPEPTPVVQHARDPFKPLPKAKPGTYTPAAPIFIQPN